VGVVDDAGARTEETWENECAECGDWSLHDDTDHSQLALIDPGDQTSEVA